VLHNFFLIAPRHELVYTIEKLLGGRLGESEECRNVNLWLPILKGKCCTVRFSHEKHVAVCQGCVVHEKVSIIIMKLIYCAFA
jgi:hypothetical protein